MATNKKKRKTINSTSSETPTASNTTTATATSRDNVKDKQEEASVTASKRRRLLPTSSSQQHSQDNENDNDNDIDCSELQTQQEQPDNVLNSTTGSQEEEEEEEEPPKLKFAPGLPTLLFDHLQSSTDSVELVEQAMDQLANLLEDASIQLLTQLVGLGGPALVMLTMRKYAQNQSIQINACYILAMIIHHHKQQQQQQPQNNNPTQLINLETLISSMQLMGVTDVVLRAMKKFPNAQQVQLFGLLVLGNMCTNTPTTTTTTTNNHDDPETASRGLRLLNTEHAGDEDDDVLHRVVSAMDTFADSSDVQDYACWFLVRLLDSLQQQQQPQKRLIMEPALARRFKTQIVRVVATAVQNFPDHPSISKDASTIMTAVLKSHHDNNSQGTSNKNHNHNATLLGAERRSTRNSKDNQKPLLR
ncbi:expressed unknown protein [Seminavis robusta]|uniref:LRRK2 ARM repeat domain-containing protein n=1 Tax=Seminavis robusta TaxID=568900 RepID=A0A9N8HUP0_9STRA|nr:expressed unknown protein [Seminavis robusta]|eukprot:Sro1849_g301530.1 n/a (418) ;mRNA; f:15435-16688